MQAVGESLKRLNQRETGSLSVSQAKSANKRRISASEESDSEMLLADTSKRQKNQVQTAECNRVAAADNQFKAS